MVGQIKAIPSAMRYSVENFIPRNLSRIALMADLVGSQMESRNSCRIMGAAGCLLCRTRDWRENQPAVLGRCGLIFGLQARAQPLVETPRVFRIGIAEHQTVGPNEQNGGGREP